MNQPQSITVRVYGLLIHQGQILLSRENIAGGIYTKFPGGGLELGEGVGDCLQREFREEVNIALNHWKLFHLNEKYLPSAFHKSKQVLSIYYRVWSDEVNTVNTAPPEVSDLGHPGDQVLYWSELDTLLQEPISLPVDVEVINLLTERGIR